MCYMICKKNLDMEYVLKPRRTLSGVVTDTVPDSETEDEEETQGTEEFYTGGGVPWIDSDIKANVTEGMNPSAREDFHLYVNYDLVWELEYVRRLGEIYTEDNLESIKADMLVKYLMGTADMLDREAYNLSVEKNNTVSGATGQATDEEYGYDILTDKLPEVVSRAYVEKYDFSETKQEIEDISSDIIGYYRQMLEDEDWLSDETRTLAFEKPDNIIVKAVYPDKWYDYSELCLDGLSFVESVRAIDKFEKARKSEKIDQSADREEWVITNILEANAFYNPSDNSINIILGILGGDFYRDDMTDEEKYGGIGSVIFRYVG